MAGFYIHIPFCRKQCYYCDFHFSVSMKHKDNVLKAIRKEMIDRKREFSGISFSTLYFGGGTPSILSAGEISDLITLAQNNYKIDSEAEITVETNPDDLSPDYLSSLRNDTIVNRLSIGVQSFNNAILNFLNRQHDSETAESSIRYAKEVGFNNINVDLIYGIPGMDSKLWKDNLEIFRSLEIAHLSAYHLTIEPNTVFAYYSKKGRISPVKEEESRNQFKILLHHAEKYGYGHYEISNFAKTGYQSKHNLGYWNGESYIGIGPSAHSFHNHIRRWNISNNTKYWQTIHHGSDEYSEHEEINNTTAYNEYVMTSLRTIKGVDMNYIKQNFGDNCSLYFEKSIQKFLKQKTILIRDSYYCLSQEGMFIADYIISELMRIDEK